jgi:excinuclease UvrABC nuclease subunit
VYRYLNHGKFVPIQKCFKFKCILSKVFIRTYTTLPNNKIARFYEDAFNMRKSNLNENKGKSGIYMLTKKLTNDIYIGQSKDISKRFMNYFNFSYLISRKNYIISRALIKYGYSNFSLTILEYCDKFDLLLREQYYFDKFNPQYNILKIAGSSRGFKHSEETKIKISKALKGVYIKEK